jgi:hypothetical protein
MYRSPLAVLSFLLWPQIRPVVARCRRNVARRRGRYNRSTVPPHQPRLASFPPYNPVRMRCQDCRKQTCRTFEYPLRTPVARRRCPFVYRKQNNLKVLLTRGRKMQITPNPNIKSGRRCSEEPLTKRRQIMHYKQEIAWSTVMWFAGLLVCTGPEHERAQAQKRRCGEKSAESEMRSLSFGGILITLFKQEQIR